MNRQHTRLWITLWALSSASALSAPIRNLVLTEVIKDVSILDAATKKVTPAKAGDVLVPPNILKTGPDSRAELIAEDKTVTRVGSNTVFSVDPNSRDINLGQGSVLLHSPTGKGGGTIKSAGATASVLGTTLIVGANPSGGFKTMLLEGKGQVTTPGSRPVRVNAGQLSFAMPGQKASAPLNFSLKGQVGSSQLVKGFSKPVASIAKIEAAVTQQQEKIASGGLSTTDLVIGDRPDTAFKLDTSLVSTVVTVQQAQEAQKIASRSELDPRYIAAVARNLSLTAPVIQLDENANPPILDGNNLFAIDGSGANAGTSYGLPKAIPGNQTGIGTHSVLIANNIVFGPTGSEYFIPLPVEVPTDTNNVALVALNGLTIGRSVHFVGFTTPTLAIQDVENVDGTHSQVQTAAWRDVDQFLLSAGNSIGITPGVTIQADVPLFEIYAGGASYSSDINLSQNAATDPSLVPINWTGVGLVNKYAVDATSPLSGKIRITAPSISITDSGIIAGAIEITADRDLSLTRTLAQTTLPLGFTSANDLTLSAYSVALGSKTAAVSLVGYNLVSSKVDITAGTDITLSGMLTTSDFNTGGHRTVSATAGRNLNLIDSELNAVTNVLGDVEVTPAVKDGSGNIITSAVTTSQLLTVNLTATTGNLNVYSGPTAPTLADNSTTPIQNLTTTEYKTVVRAQKVNFVAKNGNIVVQQLSVLDETGQVRGTITNLSDKSEFNATASDTVSLNKVDLSQSQTVALSANTTVLTDVTFKDGSYVNIKSQSGLVAPDPGYDRPVRNGMVNFIRNVVYGTTLVQNPTTPGSFAASTAAGLNPNSVSINTPSALATALGANASVLAAGNSPTAKGISISVK